MPSSGLQGYCMHMTTNKYTQNNNFSIQEILFCTEQIVQLANCMLGIQWYVGELKQGALEFKTNLEQL